MNAFKPQYLYWECLDMLRKLLLVGMVLLVGRGTAPGPNKSGGSKGGLVLLLHSSQRTRMEHM